MNYWDSSALVPLITQQARSAEMEKALAADPAMVTWWGTPLECVSALARLTREERFRRQDVRAAEQRLLVLRESWVEVVPSEACRQTAERLLRVHVLRAADALQLAAAVIAADHDPMRLRVVCLDQRLCDAAEKEGFSLVIAG